MDNQKINYKDEIIDFITNASKEELEMFANCLAKENISALPMAK